MGIEGWRRVYLVLVGINLANQVGVTAAFKDTLWSRLKVAVPGAGGSGGGQKRNRTAIRDTADVLKLRALWLLSMFYFFELGAVSDLYSDFLPSVALFRCFKVPLRRVF